MSLPPPLQTKVEALGLDGCWNAKPLVNGKDLMSELSLKKVGASEPDLTPLL